MPAASSPSLGPGTDNLDTSQMPAASSPSLGPQLSAALYLTVVNVVFGGYSVFTSAVLKHSTLSPLVFAFMRDTLATTILLSAAYAYERRQPVPRFWPKEEHHTGLLLVGLLGVWGSQGLSALAISNLTATFFATLEPCMPIVTILLSLALRQERFSTGSVWSWGKIAGALIAVGSAVAMSVLSTQGGADGGDVISSSKNFPLGLFFAALQVMMGGSYAVAQKPLLAHYSAITVAAWGYLAGTGLLLLCVITSADSAADWDVSPAAWGAIAYAGILSSSLCYFLMAHVNNFTSPVVVSSFLPLQVLAAGVIGWALNGENPNFATLVGGVGVVLGLFVAVGSRHLEGLQPAVTAGTAAAQSGPVLRVKDSSFAVEGDGPGIATGAAAATPAAVAGEAAGSYRSLRGVSVEESDNIRLLP